MNNLKSRRSLYLNDKEKKACIRSRTGDLLLTRQVLYQLSYTGLLIFMFQIPTHNLTRLNLIYFLIFHSFIGQIDENFIL